MTTQTLSCLASFSPCLASPRLASPWVPLLAPSP
ncbi:hypothetical protein E2C01_093168 [Portunus trituberculatus]|uniref:Uncharacterized protein n=1 Tax=Portunus trituberculatus TaxID=210409 RepID=A0A5B7JTT1_PORTR|nr:hypothetical protein [Portunus trituberculatus]